MNAPPLSILSERQIGAARGIITDVLPVCSICGLHTNGHSFLFLGSRAISDSATSAESDEVLRTAKGRDWQSFLSLFNAGFDGRLPTCDVFLLKCADGKCSLAVVLSPFRLEEPYILLQQTLTPELKPPVESPWHTV